MQPDLVSLRLNSGCSLSQRLQFDTRCVSGHSKGTSTEPGGPYQGVGSLSKLHGTGLLTPQFGNEKALNGPTQRVAGSHVVAKLNHTAILKSSNP